MEGDPSGGPEFGKENDIDAKPRTPVPASGELRRLRDPGRRAEKNFDEQTVAEPDRPA